MSVSEAPACSGHPGSVICLIDIQLAVCSHLTFPVNFSNTVLMLLKHEEALVPDVEKHHTHQQESLQTPGLLNLDLLGIKVLSDMPSSLS